MVQSMNHIITNDHVNLVQITVAFPIVDCLILVKEGDHQHSELSEFQSVTSRQEKT
jgi:hypothetical protein